MTKTIGSASGIWFRVNDIDWLVLRGSKTDPEPYYRILRWIVTRRSRTQSQSIQPGSQLFGGSRDAKLEAGSIRLRRRRPQAPAMRLHDTPANGESHTHAGGFRREQRLKHAVANCLIDTSAGISDGDQNVPTII